MTLRVHTGQGYFVAGPGFGCTSPESVGALDGFGPVVVVAAL